MDAGLVLEPGGRGSIKYMMKCTFSWCPASRCSLGIAPLIVAWTPAMRPTVPLLLALAAAVRVDADYADPRKSCAVGSSASLSAPAGSLASAPPCNRPLSSPAVRAAAVLTRGRRACSAGQVSVRRVHMHAKVHGRQVPRRAGRHDRHSDVRVLTVRQTSADLLRPPLPERRDLPDGNHLRDADGHLRLSIPDGRTR
jgi:hypothetical protein